MAYCLRPYFGRYFAILHKVSIELKINRCDFSLILLAICSLTLWLLQLICLHSKVSSVVHCVNVKYTLKVFVKKFNKQQQKSRINCK